MIDCTECADCKVAMEEGFILEWSRDRPRASSSVWVEGKPEKARFFSLSLSGLTLRGKKQASIVAYRCPRCGLLKQYAPNPAVT